MDTKTDVITNDIAQELYNDCIEHTMNISLTTRKGADGYWATLASINVRGSRDGKNFGKLVASAKSYDTDPKEGIAVVMMSLGAYIQDERYMVDFAESLLESEKESSEE